MKKSLSPLLAALRPIKTAAVLKEPTSRQRMKLHAREEKIHATRKWVAGELSTKEHAGVHARANAVIKGKV